MTDLAAEEMKQNVTRDRFLDGKIEVLQPDSFVRLTFHKDEENNF